MTYLKTAAWSSIVVGMVVLALFFLRGVFLPLIAAVLLALALLQPQRWLESKGLPGWLAAVLLNLLPFLVLVGLGVFFWHALGDLLDQVLASNTATAEEEMDALTESLEAQAEAKGWRIADQIQEHATTLMESVSSGLTAGIAAVGTAFGYLLLIPIYCTFMLSGRSAAKRMLDRLDPDRSDNLKHWLNASARLMRRYVASLLLVICIVGVLNIAGLFALGVKGAVVLGAFAAVLIILPYIGVIAGALLPLSVVVMTTEGWTTPLLVAGLFAAVQALEGNLITPRIMGDSINLNPVGIILFLTLMGAVAGVLGMVIAVPLLAVIREGLCLHTNTKPLAELLSHNSVSET